MAQLVNLAGLARRLHLPRNWLKDEADNARIPFLRVGRKRLFSVEAVEALLAERASGAQLRRDDCDQSDCSTGASS